MALNYTSSQGREYSRRESGPSSGAFPLRLLAVLVSDPFYITTFNTPSCPNCARDGPSPESLQNVSDSPPSGKPERDVF